MATLSELLAEKKNLPLNIRAAILEGPPGRLAELRRRAREIGDEIERAGDSRVDEQATELRSRISQLSRESEQADAAYTAAHNEHSALKGGPHTLERQRAYDRAQQLQHPAVHARAQLKLAREQLDALVTRSLEGSLAPLVRSLPHVPHAAR